MGDLVEDRRQVVGLGLEVAGMVPLEPRLELVARAPVGVAEVVVDGRVAGLERDGAFELLHGARIVAEPVIRPAEAVDDEPVLGPQRHGLAQHLEGLVEVLAPVHPGIAEVVEHHRLVRVQPQRLLEVGLGLGPLLVALVGDAAEVEQRPGRLVALGQGREGLAVGGRRRRILLLLALDVAEGGEGVDVGGAPGHDVLEVADRVLGPAHHVERQAGLHVGIVAQRARVRHLVVDRDGLVVLLQLPVKVRQGDLGEAVVRRQEQREPEVDHGGELVALAAARGAEPVEHLAGALLGGADQRLDRLAGRDVGGQRLDLGVVGQDIAEGGERPQRFVLGAVPGLEPRVGVDDAQDRVVLGIGGLEPLGGLGKVVGHVGDQRRVVVAEDREARVLEVVDGGEGLLLVALARKGPGGEQRGRDVVLAPRPAGTELAPRRHPMAVAQLAEAQHHMGETVLRVRLDETAAEVERVVDVAVRQRGHEGALDQFRIAGIRAQDLLEIGRGRLGVAVRARHQGRQIVARHAAADVGRRRQGDRLARLRGKRRAGEEEGREEGRGAARKDMLGHGDLVGFGDGAHPRLGRGRAPAEAR